MIILFLGNIRRLQGKHDEAYDLHKRAVSALKVTCGEHSVQASVGYYRLAVDEFDRGRYEESGYVVLKPTPPSLQTLMSDIVL